MASIIDTTLSGSSANSYVSVAEAESYFTAKPFFLPTWKGLITNYAFTGFTPGSTTVFTGFSDTSSFYVGQTVLVSGTSIGAVDVSQNVTAVTSTTVTTDLDSTGETTTTGNMRDEIAQEVLLIEATRLVDSFQFKGRKVEYDDPADGGQILEFPRYINSTDQTVIPIRVKQATYEAAIFIKQKRDSSGDVSTRIVNKIKVVEGLAEVEYSDDNQVDIIKEGIGGNILSIENHLRPYLEGRYTWTVRNA